MLIFVRSHPEKHTMSCAYLIAHGFCKDPLPFAAGTCATQEIPWYTLQRKAWIDGGSYFKSKKGVTPLSMFARRTLKVSSRMHIHRYLLSFKCIAFLLTKSLECALQRRATPCRVDLHYQEQLSSAPVGVWHSSLWHVTLQDIEFPHCNCIC